MKLGRHDFFFLQLKKSLTFLKLYPVNEIFHGLPVIIVERMLSHRLEPV